MSKMTTRCRRRSRKECDFLLKMCLACFNAYVFAGTEFRQGMGLMGAEGAALSSFHQAACNILMQDTGDKGLVW